MYVQLLFNFSLSSCSYTKPKGQLPDYSAPVVLQLGRSSIEDLCNNLHKSIMKEFKQSVYPYSLSLSLLSSLHLLSLFSLSLYLLSLFSAWYY